ncbi:MAG TPA: ABC transporter permease [Solirubrobacteraceae bacterium]|nr:ABC transporter permease [Solirubrobacteraceae bacterium]
MRASPPAVIVPVLRALAAPGRMRRPALLRESARRVVPALAPLGLIAVLLGAWELYVRLGSVDPLILPPPTAVARSLFDDRGLLWSNFTVTAGEALGGIGLALIAALALAMAIHFSRSLRLAVYPLLIASQAIPLVLLAPLLSAWLGFGLAPKLVIVVLVSFFPILVATLDALAATDPDLLKLVATLGATRWQAFVRVEAPNALPGLFTGARVAVVFALIGAFLGEWSGASRGLGVLVEQAIPQLQTARAAAAVTLLAGFALLLFGALGLLERRLLPWTTAATS